MNRSQAENLQRVLKSVWKIGILMKELAKGHTYVEYGWLVRKKKNIGKVGVEKLDEYQRTGLED